MEIVSEDSEEQIESFKTESQVQSVDPETVSEKFIPIKDGGKNESYIDKMPSIRDVSEFNSSKQTSFIPKVKQNLVIAEESFYDDMSESIP